MSRLRLGRQTELYPFMFCIICTCRFSGAFFFVAKKAFRSKMQFGHPLQWICHEWQVHQRYNLLHLPSSEHRPPQPPFAYETFPSDFSSPWQVEYTLLGIAEHELLGITWALYHGLAIPRQRQWHFHQSIQSCHPWQVSFRSGSPPRVPYCPQIHP